MKYLINLTLLIFFKNISGQSVVNYSTARNTNITYSSISASGNSFSSWRNSTANTQDDNRSDLTDIGFDFWYDGVRYTQFSASTNGFIDFSSSTADGTQSSGFGYSNAAFTTFNTGNATRPAIAPFYDDLTAQGNIAALGNSIKYLLTGTAPNRVLTIEWINMATFQNVTPSLNFQVKLAETTGIITMHYGVMNTGNKTFSYSMGLNAPTMSATPTVAQLKELQTANGSTFNNTVQNNLSTMPAANSQYIFTSPAPTAVSGSLTFSGVSQTSMSLNWPNWASNEVGYAIYNSTDGVNYDFVTQSAVNATSANITGLLPSTTYYWKLYAVTEGYLSSPLTGSQITSVAGNKISITTGNWGTANTWSPTGVPTAGDNVIIANTHVVGINVDGQCNNLTIGQGGTSTLRFTGNTARNLVVNNNITLNANSSFNVNTSSNVNHSLEVDGNIVNNGSIDFLPDANSMADILFSKNGNQTLSGSGSNNFNRININLSGIDNTFEITSSNFTAANNFLDLTSGMFKISTTSAVNITPFTSPYTIPATAGLWLNSSNLLVNTTAGVVLFGKTIIGKGVLNIGDAANEDFEFSGGSISVINGSLNVAGRLDGSDINNPSEFNISGGAVLVPAYSSTNTSIAPFHVSGAGSVCNLTGGLIVIPRAGGSGQNLGFTNVGASNASVVGGTLQIGNSSTSAGQIIDINTDGDINNLVVNSTNVTARLNTYSLNVLNNITVTSGTLNANNLSLALGGNWNNAGLFTPGTGAVTFNSSSAQTILKTGGETFNDLNFSGTGIKTFSSAVNTNGNVTISNGSSVDASTSNFALSVKKNLINNGTFLTRKSNVLLNGTTSQYIGGSTPIDFYNLTLNNTAGAILSGAENLLGTLSLNNGLLNVNSQLFTMVSTSTTTARIGQITGTGDISGNVTVQRFMPGGATGWALVGNPTTSSLTFTSWDDNLIITCPTCPDGSGAGFTSIYTYNEPVAGAYDNAASYVSINSINDAISTAKGYWVYLGTSQYTTTPLTLDFTGAVRKFNYAVPLAYTNNGSSADDGWNLIYNPYPSAISWASLKGSTNNVDNAFYTYNADLNSGTGGFATYVNGISSPAVASGGVGDAIPMSQGFFVHSTGATSLSATESIKVALDPTFLRTTNANTSAQLRINLDGPYDFLDETVLYFQQGATNAFDNDYDAIKMHGQNVYAPTIALQTGTNVFQVNGVSPISGSFTSDLKTLTGYTGSYTISINDINSFPMGACINLYDKFTTTTTDLRNADYVFNLSDTTSVSRFVLSITLNALTVTSTVEQPECKSPAIGKIKAKGSGAGPWNYYWKSNGATVQTSLNKFTADSLSNVNSGNFDLEVNTVGLCDYNQSSYFIDQQIPSTSLFTSIDTVFIGSGVSVQFTNNSQNASINDWDFGTGQDYSNLISPLFNYHSPGVFNVKLIVTSITGCKDTSSKRVTVIDNLTRIETITSSGNSFILKTMPDNQFVVQAEFAQAGTFNADVRDLQGKLIKGFDATTGNNVNLDIDLSTYSKGIYFLTITSGTVKKVVKLSVE